MKKEKERERELDLLVKDKRRSSQRLPVPLAVELANGTRGTGLVRDSKSWVSDPP